MKPAPCVPSDGWDFTYTEVPHPEVVVSHGKLQIEHPVAVVQNKVLQSSKCLAENEHHLVFIYIYIFFHVRYVITLFWSKEYSSKECFHKKTETNEIFKH